MNPAPQRSLGRALPIAGALWALWPTAALAAQERWTECEIRVVGGGGSEWAAAAERMRQEGSVRLTCREVVLWVHPNGATLEFRADNGSSTLRHLEDPLELTSTMAALSFVPFPPSNAREHAHELTTISRREPSRVPEPPAAATLSSPAGCSLGDAGLVAVEGGVRTGSDHRVTPVMEAFFGLAAGRTELGVTARYEARHASLGAGEAVSGHGMALGARVGRRHPLWGTTLLFGGQAQVALVTETERATGSRATGGEARIGAYTGLILAHAEPFALRTTLGLEVVPDRIGRSERATERAFSPWWAVTLGVGGEFGGA